jgi:serine/threonine-protein kinase
MEYVDGDELISHCNKNQYTNKQRLSLFIQLCNAMEFAHKNLVIHRDIKPGNIMVARNGKVKLTDFGIAKILKENNPGNQTSEHTKVMTPDYASPEQLTNQYINTASDIYQLGVILYELLTNQHAYNKEKRKHEFEFTGKTIPAELISIIQTATRTETSERYNSVENLKDDILNFMQNKPVKAKGNNFTYRARKYFIRNKTLILSVFLIIFAIGFLTVRYIKDINEARRFAEYQSLQAKSTENFLFNIFRQQFPRNASGDTLTTFDLIDRMAFQLEHDKTFPEENVSKVFNYIGEIIYRYGDYGKSYTYFHKALNYLSVDTFEPFASKQTKYSAYLGLGRLFFTVQNRDSSAFYLNKALAYAHQNNINPMGAYTFLARLEMLRGNYKLADSLFQEAYAITRKKNNLTKDEVAYFNGMYGNFLSKYFPYENKELIDSLFSRSLEMYNSRIVLSEHETPYKFFKRKDTIYGYLVKQEYPTSYAEILNYYGISFYRYEQYDSAAFYFEKAYQANKKYYGENSIVALENANNLAVIYREKGEYEKAQNIFLECWNKSRQNKSITPAFAMGFFHNYGAVFYNRKKYKKALHALDSVIEMRKKHTPSDHFSFIHAYTRKGQTFRKLNQPYKGLEFLKKAVNRHKNHVGNKGFQDINAQMQMILIYGDLGDYANVEKFYQDNHNKIKNRFGADSHYLYKNSVAKASALLAMNKYAEAETFLKPVLQDSIRDQEKNHLLFLFAKSQYHQGATEVSDSIISLLQTRKQLSPTVTEALESFILKNQLE